MAVLREEDGKIGWTKFKGRRAMVGNCIVEGGISLFAVGFGLGEFFHGKASDFFLALQKILNVNILTMGLVAVLVHFLCGVFRNDGLDIGSKLVGADRYIGVYLLQELQAFVNVGRKAFVERYVVKGVVDHKN